MHWHVDHPAEWNWNLMLPLSQGVGTDMNWPHMTREQTRQQRAAQQTTQYYEYATSNHGRKTLMMIKPKYVME